MISAGVEGTWAGVHEFVIQGSVRCQGPFGYLKLAIVSEARAWLIMTRYRRCFREQS